MSNLKKKQETKKPQITLDQLAGRIGCGRDTLVTRRAELRKAGIPFPDMENTDAWHELVFSKRRKSGGGGGRLGSSEKAGDPSDPETIARNQDRLAHQDRMAALDEQMKREDLLGRKLKNRRDDVMYFSKSDALAFLRDFLGGMRDQFNLTIMDMAESIDPDDVATVKDIIESKFNNVFLQLETRLGNALEADNSPD